MLENVGLTSKDLVTVVFVRRAAACAVAMAPDPTTRCPSSSSTDGFVGAAAAARGPAWGLIASPVVYSVVERTTRNPVIQRGGPARPHNASASEWPRAVLSRSVLASLRFGLSATYPCSFTFGKVFDFGKFSTSEF